MAGAAAGDASYATAGAEPARRRELWSEAVSRIYFPLDLDFRRQPVFSGSLDLWALGAVSISRNVSDGLLYRRHQRHLGAEREESYLVTIPERAEISFTQAGRDVRCRPGSFLIERSHLPYEFSTSEPNALWVLKVPAAMLRARLGEPERLAALIFDADAGAGRLFVDMLRISVPRLAEMDGTAREVVGKHLVDLLALAVEADGRMLGTAQSAVQTAHLRRVERFIRANLAESQLTPRRIAEASGISVRTLHLLFESQGTTVCAWMREQRLLMCEEALRDGGCRKSISEIAYKWGFGDQAQFSRHFRTRFGCTPSDARAAARTAR
jgi:AraC-like DNA-binding protein